MTWLLAESCQLLAVAVSIRYSFKILSNLSRKPSKQVEETAAQILKFWVLFAFLRIFEAYLEYFIRWFPFYYYFKATLFVLICIPELKIAHLIFNDIIIPSIDRLQHHVLNEDGAAPTPVEIYMTLSTALLVVVFPGFLTCPTRKTFPRSDSGTSLVSSEGEAAVEGVETGVEADEAGGHGAAEDVGRDSDGGADSAWGEEAGSGAALRRTQSEHFFIEDIYDEYDSSVPTSGAASEDEAADGLDTPLVSPWRSSLNKRHRNVSLRKRGSSRLSAIAAEDISDLATDFGTDSPQQQHDQQQEEEQQDQQQAEEERGPDRTGEPEPPSAKPAGGSSLLSTPQAGRPSHGHGSKRSSLGSDFGSPFLPSPVTVFGGAGGALRTARRLSQLSSSFRRLTVTSTAVIASSDVEAQGPGASPGPLPCTPEASRERPVPSSGELFPIGEDREEDAYTDLPDIVARAPGRIRATRRVSYSSAGGGGLDSVVTQTRAPAGRVSMGPSYSSSTASSSARARSDRGGDIMAKRSSTSPAFGRTSLNSSSTPPLRVDVVRPSVSSRLSKSLRKLSPLKNSAVDTPSSGGWPTSIFDFDIHHQSANTVSRRKSVLSLKKKM
jgi:hypothetical protein